MEIGCNYYNKPIGTVLEKYKRVLGKVVPTPAGAHVRLKAYDYMSIVYDEGTLVSYISTQPVPEGVEITNRDFWQPLNVSGYADDNIIIVTDKNESGQLIPYTLEEVLPTIADVARKPGAILSFFSMENGSHWELWQYSNLNNYEWKDTSNWRSLYNEYGKFVGWYNTLENLQKIYVGTYAGKYAIVGSELRDSVIYEGRADGWYPLDSNLYQKFFDDLIYNIDNETISLTDDQKASFKAFICGTSDEGCDDDTPSSDGNVKSIGVSVPTGFTVTGSPVTSEGTIEINYADGYSLPSAAKQLKWDTAYNWGNHAEAGYLSRASVPSWVLNGGKPEYNFSEIKNKPNTLSGYGITNGVTSEQWQVLYDLIKSITPGESDIPVITEPIASINKIGHNPSIGNQILVYNNNQWQYTTYNTSSGSGDYDDTWIKQWQVDVTNILDTLQNDLSDWKDDVRELQNNIEKNVKTSFANLLNDAEWLQENFPIGEIFSLDGWSEEMQGYLKIVGLITSEGNVGWTSLTQTVNSLQAKVDSLVTLDSGDLEAFEASLQQYIDDVAGLKTSVTALTNSWVYSDGQDILEWMASGFIGHTDNKESFFAMYSEDKTATADAIAAVETRVTNHDGAINTIASLTTRVTTLEGSDGIAGIKSTINTYDGRIEEVRTLVSSTLNNLSANFVAKTDLDSAVAALITTNGSSTATVLLQTIGSKSVLDLIADRITLTGYTVVDGEAEFTGNIKAKSLTLDENGYVDIGGEDEWASFKLWSGNEGDSWASPAGLILQQSQAVTPLDGGSTTYTPVRNVSLSNIDGISVYADGRVRNTSGSYTDADGFVDIGTFTKSDSIVGQDTRETNNAFGIQTAYNGIVGIGYNGTAGGLRFINGICVGTA